MSRSLKNKDSTQENVNSKKMSIDYLQIESLIRQAIAEDLPNGDLTTASLLEFISKNSKSGSDFSKNNNKLHFAKFHLIFKEAGVLAGLDIVPITFLIIESLASQNGNQKAIIKPATTNQVATNQHYQNLKSKLFSFSSHNLDGNNIANNQVVASGEANIALLFSAERIILNLVQHLSGIATKTKSYVQALNNPKIAILDTRKTLPNLRYLQKYAVTIGGGVNHRPDLSSMMMFKDNHLAVLSQYLTLADLPSLIYNARQNGKKIEIECDEIEQLPIILKSQPDIIMLDNMTVEKINKSSALIHQFSQEHGLSIKIEVSGGVNLQNIANYRNCDVDFISIGSLTHSVNALDISLEIT